MDNKLQIEFDYKWILEHKDDDELPIAIVKNMLLNNYVGQVEFVDEAWAEIGVVVDKKVDLLSMQKWLMQKLNEKYGNDCAVTIKIGGEVDKQKDAEEQKNRVADEDKPLTKTEDASNTYEGVAQTKDDLDEVAKCIQSIDAMVGGEEYKALTREIVDIAPQMRKSGKNDAFVYQSYLFSINDGNGLSTYLKTFARLLKATDIVDVDASKPVVEIKLPAPDNKEEARRLFDDLYDVMKRRNGNKVKIICIDIREWMNNLNDSRFKELLRGAEKTMENNIFVFRVPFVDKTVLNKIKGALNDLVFIRSISFAPLNEKEIRDYAKTIFLDYGFSLTPKAWEIFQQRIVEEKSDGKFYGLNTIKKVAMELLYKKQLSNAQSKKPNNVIDKNQAKSICHAVDDEGESGYEMLSKLVGGENIRKKLDEIIAQIDLARKEDALGAPCIHMRFVGNPGTGKTTVARIIGKILKEKGVLRSGNFFEYSGRDFCGRYVGETAPKTASMCRDAYGSVMFIDEAYSLFRGDDNDRDFGREALDTLIAEMENHRSEMVVIMAGYTDDMDKLMKGNAGLASRMPYIIEFPSFTRQQLYEIFCSMVTSKFSYEDEMLESAKEYFLAMPDDMIKAKEFSNARFVRNLFERTWAKAAMRSQLSKCDKIQLKKEDFLSARSEKEFEYTTPTKQKIGF